MSHSKEGRSACLTCRPSADYQALADSLDESDTESLTQMNDIDDDNTDGDFKGWKANFKASAYDVKDMKEKGARNNDASSIKAFDTKCKAIVYEHAGYKGWKATFKAGAYPFNALKAKSAKNDTVSSIVVQKVADEKMEMNIPPILKAYEKAIHGRDRAVSTQ